MVVSLTKSCPRVRGKWYGEAMTKGERLKAAQLFYCSPQSAYADSSPARGGAFWRSANSYVKPALKGEVDMSVSEWTEGLHRGFACLRQPLSQ